MPAASLAADGTFAIEDVRAMVRSLLRDRFQLAAHTESRDLPTYALIAARNDGRLGPSLRRSGATCPPIAVPAWIPAPPPPPPGPGTPMDPNCAGFAGPGFIAGRRITMLRFANMLSIFVARAVEDKTGLSGDFDLELGYLPDPAIPTQGRLAPSPALGATPELFTALQEQLGLKLDSTRGPVDVVVIDHLERLQD